MQRLGMAGDDPDQDGRTNREEYQAGTDPATPASMIRITGVQKTDSYVQVSWFADNAVNYQLQRSDSLIQPNWTNIYTTIQGSGTLTTASDYNPGSGPRFYRVIVVP